MAPFRDRLEDFQRLDWLILQNGAIALYHKRAILDEDRAWLAASAYEIRDLDAAPWITAADAHDALKSRLNFRDGYAANLASLIDALEDLRVPDDGGTALVIRHFDAFARREPAFAAALLEAIESTSRRFLLFGKRFLALVQSDDKTLRLSPVGARPVVWNPREVATATRSSTTP